MPTTPAEQQQYPTATISEREAHAILPPFQSGQPRRNEGPLTQLLRDRAHLAEETSAERRVMNAAERERAALELQAVSDSAALADPLYLILGPKASTPSDDGSDLLQEIDELPDRLERAARQKARTSAMADFLGDIDDHLASKLRSCGSVRLYRHWLQTGDCRLRAMYTCKQDKLCPQCAALRAAKHAAAYAEKVEHVQHEATAGVYLWTWTIVSDDDVTERLDHLIGNFREVLNARRKSRSSSGRHGWSPLSGMIGGVYSVEVIRGKGGGWHPHLHLLALHDEAPRGIDLDGNTTRDMEVPRYWEGLTSDSFVVDCKPVDDLGGACCEVLKYAMKFSGMELADNLHAWQATRGKRLMASVGNLRGVTVPDNLLDAISNDDGPWLDLAYRYDYTARAYAESEPPKYGQPLHDQELEGVPI